MINIAIVCTWTVPTLVAEMRPPTVTALDILPYNTFTLRCIANAPADVILQKTFVWRNGSNIIADNGDTVLIANLNTAMPESTSELTVNGPTIGTYTYYCTVTISVPGGLDISAFTSGVATIEGNLLVVHSVLLCHGSTLYLYYRTESSSPAQCCADGEYFL